MQQSFEWIWCLWIWIRIFNNES